jgi:hypothetical protein
MQHPNVLSSHDVYQLTRLNVPDFDEIWLKGKDIRV